MSRPKMLGPRAGQRCLSQQVARRAGLVRGLEEAELLAGVRGVRDELADEDLLIRVQGVGDDVQQLLRLRAELVPRRSGPSG